MKISVDVYDNYNRPESKGEPGGGKQITESAGYIPIRVQVENMLLAGERLGEYRREKYDFGEGVEIPDDVVPDPTRSASFDMADGSQIARVTAANLSAQAREAKKKADENSAALVDQEAPPKGGV